MEYDRTKKTKKADHHEEEEREKKRRKEDKREKKRTAQKNTRTEETATKIWVYTVSINSTICIVGEKKHVQRQRRRKESRGEKNRLKKKRRERIPSIKLACVDQSCFHDDVMLAPERHSDRYGCSPGKYTREECGWGVIIIISSDNPRPTYYISHTFLTGIVPFTSTHE